MTNTGSPDRNSHDATDVTVLLSQLAKGDDDARSSLFRLVEDELRKTAEGLLRRERADHTLQATVLVDDVFMKLVGPQPVECQSRKHFYRLAARAMRRILVDHERKHRAVRRGGGKHLREVIELRDIPEVRGQNPDVSALHEALEKLERIDPRQSETVVLWHFGGYKIREIADILDISEGTVNNELAAARAWIKRQLERDKE